MTSQLSLADLSLLLVEPSSTQARIIAEHLEAAGLQQISVAASGAEALEHMRRQLPDLVASAMYFPDMTGSDLIAVMRDDDRLRDVPFMLVSSESQQHNLEPIRQAGVMAILPKPFGKNELDRALKASLDYLIPEELELADMDVDDLRVLVVDDSRWARRHIAQMLRHLGVQQLTLAENGRDAAELIRDHTFDLVVTDYHMPEMDGEQLINYIRHVSTQPDLPILMITGEQDASRLTAVRQAGVSALTDKPFDIGTLRELARNLLTEPA